MRDTPQGRLLAGKSLEVPAAPLQGQVKGPKCPPGYVVISGGCWVRSEHKPPCPETFWRSGDGCYLPLMAGKYGSNVGAE